MTTRECPSRRPWVAAALSLACPGLGQVYAGGTARGLALLLVTWLLAPAAAIVVAFGEPSDARLLGLLGAVALSLALVMFSIIDAAIQAARATPAAVGVWNRPAVLALLLAIGLAGSTATTILVRANLFSAYVVPQGSMAPAVAPGDRVLARRLGAGASTPAPGRVVVFRNPRDRRQLFVKRVAAHADALPGTFWALGDARENSFDSRAFGPVPVGDVLGEVQYIFWPPRRFGTVGPFAGEE